MTTTNTSNPSLGQIGAPYYDVTNNRVKFFDTTLHETAKTLDDLIGECEKMKIKNDASRITARFLVDNSVLSQIPNVEATIPLNGTYECMSLIYVGVNDYSRVDSQEVLSQEQNLVERVLNTRRSEVEINENYSIIRMTRPTEGNIVDMVSLYEEAFPTYTTELNEDAIRNMCESSVVYVAMDADGRIVSTTVAEQDEFATDRGMFSIVELSEMATLREHRNQGLSRAITERMLYDLDADVIYAEARSCNSAINKVFHNLGFNFAGTLNKQCILSGDGEIQEQGPYENLNVWYITGE